MNESVFLYRIFNISSGKQKKLFKGSQGEDGTLIKVRAQSMCSGPDIRRMRALGGQGLVVPAPF